MPFRPETFIAHRLYFAHRGEQRASRPAVRVALWGIIIGVMVMTLTFCVVVGFKHTVINQIAGFNSHIQVTNFDTNNTYELAPVTVTDSMLEVLSAIPHVSHASRFLTKPGVLKTATDFRGIVLKGTSYWDYFANHLVAGHLPNNAQQVLISKQMADWMRLNVDSTFFCYFVGQDLRVRKFTIAGLYQTGCSEWDKQFIIGQEQAIRPINHWSDSLSSGIEIQVDDLAYVEETANQVYFATANQMQDNGEMLNTRTLQDLNPQIFAWLDLLNMNVVVIIILMLCVSGFNIISGLIILILDSIRLIGTLKALGADNRFVRRIFITQATMLVGKGMLWGNVIGLTLAAIEYFTHVLPLDSATYYVSYVPIAFPWGALLLLNIGTILISLLILLAPSALITRISPARVMHFD